MQKENKSTNAA